MRTKRGIALTLMLGLTVSLSAISASADEKKTFVFGDTTFNAENEEADVNPQNTYAAGLVFVMESVKRCLSILMIWKLNRGLRKNLKM